MLKKQDITVIILTYNEELHIRRCINNVMPIAKEIIVIDCFSKDGTKQICEAFGVKVIEHEWPGNQAAQFNWALENVDINTEWVFRLDADEYLSKDLINEIEKKLPLESKDVNGIILKRKVFFLNKLMKHGANIELLRIFRKGFGKSEARIMDEHIILESGRVVRYDNLFYDYSLIDIDDWTKKHLGYAKRNAAEFLNQKYGLCKTDNKKLKGKAKIKRRIKRLYIGLPLFIRPFIRFFYRYIIQGSFLDGKEGFLWCFYQAWWNNTMIDTRIWEIQKACGKDEVKIKEYINNHYGIILE